MADEKFYLRFENDLDSVNMDMGAEFIGWDKAKLMMKQRDGGFGRDESFDASEADYAPERGHHFQKLQQAFDQHGFEMKVKQGVISEDRTIEYDLDGGGIETNEIDYLRSPLIQGGKLQLLKDRMETKINVFSDTTLDGEAIDPLITENILYYAYPTVDVSSWKTSAPAYGLSTARYTKFPSQNPIYNGVLKYINSAMVSLKYDIQDSVGFVFPVETVSVPQLTVGQYPPLSGGSEGLVFIDAANNLNDVKVKLTNIQYKVKNIVNEGSSGSFSGGSASGSKAKSTLVYRIGTSFSDSVRTEVWSKEFGDTEQPFYNFPSNFTINIPFIARNERLYIYFENVIWGRFEPNNPGQSVQFYSYYSLDSRLDNLDVEITATQFSYNTIVPMLRLYDIMKYWVKSACGLGIDAPRFGIGGEFYPLRLSNGNLFRLKKNEPFYITGKQIMDSIGNHFLADYELNWDGQSIFFGLFEDFYKDVEIASFNAEQFQSLKKKINPRFTFSNVKFKFSKYESQRENTQQNTVDEIHGEMELFMPNGTKNAYEKTIEWVMSARYLERNRRAAIEETSSTATNDDDTIFAIDVNDAAVENTNAIPFTENSFLQHAFDPESGALSLRNDGSFSWVALGITINQPFVITTNPSQENDGIYNVLTVSNSEITIFPISATPTSGNDGERNTRYTYLVDVSTLGGVTWTDQGLTITGVANADRYPNVRFPLGGSLGRYHSKYLATMAYFHENNYLRTTFYKNNPNAEINGLREGGQIRPGYPEGAVTVENPIITPFMYEQMVLTGNEITLATWDRLVEQKRTARGYIRIPAANFVKKVYIKLGGWSVADQAIVFDEAEEKFEPYIINIWKDDQGFVRINADDYHITQLKYDPQGLEYRIMDRENQLLYNPIFWNRIYINGNKPESQNQLEEWLMSL